MICPEAGVDKVLDVDRHGRRVIATTAMGVHVLVHLGHFICARPDSLLLLAARQYPAVVLSLILYARHQMCLTLPIFHKCIAPSSPSTATSCLVAHDHST